MVNRTTNSLNATLPSKPAIRMAVIGAGVMGNHHLRICSVLKGIDLIGVVDVEQHKAESSAKQYQCRAFARIEDLLGKVDAVIIAAPTKEHTAIGTFFLSNGIHCLIEKPLAQTEDEGQQLIALAEQNKLILSVGHTEHFNPAVHELKKILQEGHTIKAIHAQRLSQNNRYLEDDVVMDLMVHDLEVLQSIMKYPVVKISAGAVMGKRGNNQDYVSATLMYADGAIATVIASRMTPARHRQLCITTDKAYIVLDYNAQSITVHRLIPYSGNETAKAPEKIGKLSQVAEQLMVRSGDSLQIEIQQFIKSIHEKQQLGVDGRQALASLRLVWSIQQELYKHVQHVQNTSTVNTSTVNTSTVANIFP